MPRKGENIYKRKDGRWEGRYIKDRDTSGKAIYGYVYGKSYKIAKCMQREAIKSLSSKENSSEDCHSIFDAIFDKWLSQKKSHVKESTYVQYERIIDMHLRPTWGSVAVSSISDNLYNSFVDELLCHGRLDGSGGLSAKTVADIAVVFRNTIIFAQSFGIPVKGSFHRTHKKRQYHKPLKVLSREEEQKLISYLTNSLDPERLCILMALFFGLRIGEICALQWKDIDFSNGVVHIRRTLQRIKNSESNDGSKTKIVISKPKSECSVRDIPAPSFLTEMLSPFACSQDAFILTGQDHLYVEPRTLQYRFKRMMIECGLEPINFHALRHTFATRCVELGFDLKSLSEILGHSNVSITLNRYVHPSFETKLCHMEKLATLT